MNGPLDLEKAAFILSLDTELAWGWTGNRRLDLVLPRLKRVRSLVPRLLGVLETYHVPATWALVGKLFTEPDQGAGELEETGSLRAAADLLRSIRQSPVPHEIASHSFAHPDFSRVDALEAESDLRQAVEIASQWGLTLSSFVFPGNQVGHLDRLAGFGFQTYRGPEVAWFDGYPRLARRAFRQIDLALALAPPVNYPELTDGLVNLAGSMLFRIPSWGLAKRLPPLLLARKAIKGIRRAIQERALFHLWFHPSNFAHKPQEHFKAFEKTLRCLAAFRDQGLIQTTTMGALARQVLCQRAKRAVQS